MSGQIFDVAIVGAGLVGSSLALALRGMGLSIALIETKAPTALPQDESWDNRVYAISPTLILRQSGRGFSFDQRDGQTRASYCQCQAATD